MTSNGDPKHPNRKNSGGKVAADAITFDEFLNGDFAAKSFNGSWWSETELQWKDQV